jgi:hypothetical protein
VTHSDGCVHINRDKRRFRYLLDYLEYVSNMVKLYHLDCCEGTLVPDPPRVASTDVHGLCQFCRDSSLFVSCLPADPQLVAAIKAEFDFWGVPFPQPPLGSTALQPVLSTSPVEFDHWGVPFPQPPLSSTALVPVLSMPPTTPAGHVRPPSRRKSTVCALPCGHPRALPATERHAWALILCIVT